MSLSHIQNEYFHSTRMSKTAKIIKEIQFWHCSRMKALVSEIFCKCTLVIYNCNSAQIRSSRKSQIDNAELEGQLESADKIYFFFCLKVPTTTLAPSVHEDLIVRRVEAEGRNQLQRKTKNNKKCINNHINVLKFWTLF
ncbi:uncharacterized protein LOC142231419 [Haematobia irritans]|uniref:uncharacterized protein LOC142231419 n=1 Tax=Haematobia irritans TaxID=7368 RepID=UPI003F503EA3